MQAPRRWEEVEAELKKCQALCKACHRKKSDGELAQRNLKPITHGTPYGYKRGCRCEECVAATAEYKREWKLKRGIVTGRRKNVRAVCGSASTYSSGCRCDDCRKAHTEKLREYRAGLRLMRATS